MVNTMQNICRRYWKVLNDISGLFENDVNESMLIPYKQRLGTIAGDKAVYNDVLMKRCLKTLEYVALYLHYLHLKSTTLVLVQNTINGLVAVDYERDDDVLAFLAAIVQFYVGVWHDRILYLRLLHRLFFYLAFYFLALLYV